MPEFFRPNLWPNTPDILTEHSDGRPAGLHASAWFSPRRWARATGSTARPSSCCEDEAREPGSEEYAASEKYQLRDWDLERDDSLAELIALVNRARHEHPALQSDRGLASTTSTTRS